MISIGRLVRGGRIVVVAFTVALIAGCGSTHRATTTAPAKTKTTTTPASSKPHYAYDAPTPTIGTVLSARIRPTTYQQVDTAMNNLYRSQPGILSFSQSEVEYSVTTRNVVLSVCRGAHKGKSTASSRESTRIIGCAPLIFYYYSYGQTHRSMASLELARRLYWYGVTDIKGPFSAKATLVSLLESWGLV